MILFMAALGSMPKEMLEVAWLEGASAFQTFRYIKLRYLSPTIMFVTLYSLINSFKIFREVHLLAGDYPFDTLYTLQHFMNNMFAKVDYQKLSAAAIVMCAVMIVIIGALFLIENHYGLEELLVTGPITAVSIHPEFQPAWFFVTAVLSILAMVFRRGEELQTLSDETL